MRRFDVVVIEWEDIVSLDGSWISEHEGLKPEDSEVFTAGIVWKLERSAVTVIRDRCFHGQENGGEQRIPRGVIKRVHRVARLRKRGKKWEFVTVSPRRKGAKEEMA